MSDKPTFHRRVVFWLPALIWAAGIFWLSAQPSLPPVGPQLPHIDKLDHFLAYALLGALVYRGLRRGHNLSLRKAAGLAILITAAYGASDEFHQYFVPNRECEWGDWIADSLGAVAAATGYYVYESYRSRKTHC